MSFPPPTSNGGGADSRLTSPGPTGPEPLPAPGDLHIKEKRTWKSWQMAVVALVFLLVGMAANAPSSGSTGSSSSSAPAYTIPKSTGSTTTTAAATSGSTTTAASSGSTTTTAAGGSATTSSTAAAGPPRVLLGPTQLQGNWTSPAFTTTAPNWNIGWAFNCTPAPASGPSFQVFVVPAGSSPSGTPAISETGPSGQSVSAQTTTGSQTLVVQAPATCTWAVKVTGS